MWWGKCNRGMWSSVSTTLYMNNCHDITGPWLCPLCGNYDGEYRVESVKLAMLKLFWSQSAFGSHKCNSGTREKPELTEPYRNNSLSFNFHNTKVKFSSWLTVTENATKYVRFRRLCSSESLDLVTFVLFVSPWLFFFCLYWSLPGSSCWDTKQKAAGTVLE